MNCTTMHGPTNIKCRSVYCWCRF